MASKEILLRFSTICGDIMYLDDEIEIMPDRLATNRNGIAALKLQKNEHLATLAANEIRETEIQKDMLYHSDILFRLTNDIDKFDTQIQQLEEKDGDVEVIISMRQKRNLAATEQCLVSKTLTSLEYQMSELARAKDVFPKEITQIDKDINRGEAETNQMATLLTKMRIQQASLRLLKKYDASTE